MKREFFHDPYLALSLPLWERDAANGQSFMSDDAYGHLATVTGALWTPQGRLGDGIDDTIDCGDAVALDIRDAITLEAWVYPTSLADTWMIMSRDDVTNRNFIFSVATNGSLTFDFFISNSGKTASGGASSITINNWWHVVGTYDGTTGKVYINGNIGATTVAASGQIDNDDVTFYIGSRKDAAAGSRDYYVGTIGEVRVYSRALSPLEVLRNYLTTKWRFK